MSGNLVLAVLAALVLVSLVIPTLRRVWVFHLYALKYLVAKIGDLIGVRRIWLRSTGRRYAPLTGPLAARLFFEDMGPTFIKFGQIVASSAGIFPERYVREFQKCLDRVRPFDFASVVHTIHEELGEERARQLVDIDPKPLASASIAQVHTASLRDGTSVVIKVQRPGIERRMDADMKIMRLVAALIAKLFSTARLVNPVGIIDDFSATLKEELDFRKEAGNLERFNDIMRELGYRDIRAPVPHWELTTTRVLVMERFVGTRVDDADAIKARDIDAEAALVKGLRAWFQCVIFYGFFHGDVHAGNLMILENEDLGFLDFGIVGRFDERQRRLVTDYIVAFSIGDYKTLAKVIVEMGGASADEVDMDSFVTDLEATYKPLLTMSFGDVNYADIIPKINMVAREHNMTMPREFVLITKQMLYFDRYAKLLAPALNVFADPRLVMSLMTDIQRARSEQATAPEASS